MRHLLTGKLKNDVIYIDLSNEYIAILLLYEECFIHTCLIKMVIKKKICESFIPSSKSLFETIQSLLESVYIVRQVRAHKSLRLLSVYFLLENSI